MSETPDIDSLNEMLGVDGNRQQAINWLINRLTYAEVLAVNSAGAYSQDQGNRHLNVTAKCLEILGVTEAEMHAAFLLLPLPQNKEENNE